MQKTKQTTETAVTYEPMLGEVHFDFELNGKKYAQIPKKQSKSKLPALLQTMVAMGGMMGYEHKERERPKVNLIREYGLIELKKSKLSKSDRDWVCFQFERTFVRVG